MRNDLVPIAKLLEQMRDDQKRLEQSHVKLLALVQSFLSEATRASSPATGAGQGRQRLQRLQADVQRENAAFTSVSNVLKARHDAAKNSINNIR